MPQKEEYDENTEALHKALSTKAKITSPQATALMQKLVQRKASTYVPNEKKQ